MESGRSRPSTSAYWSARATSGYAPNWYSFCAELINQRVTGWAGLSPTPWVLARQSSAPAKHLLEIGCLEGDKIVSLLRAGLAIKASGVDIAIDAIARGRAKHDGAVQLDVMDLNAPDLARGAFDVILANGVLHHIENLEVCVQHLYDALEPGGMLAASDFTGPRRYAYTAKEIRHINRGVAMLPYELRYQFDPAQLRPKLDADPSEAVRTRDIEPVLRATFDNVEARPYGGNVLMRALSPQFFAAFDATNNAHTESVARVIAYDTEVYQREPSHHTYMVAAKT